MCKADFKYASRLNFKTPTTTIHCWLKFVVTGSICTSIRPPQDENPASKIKSPFMASPITTRVLEESSIYPPPNLVLDTSVPLTTYDLPYLGAFPVHLLFFYNSPHPAAPFIETLKSSLSLTLQHFFTLAGTIHISANRIYINYTNGNTIPFTVVESNSDFHHLVSSQKHDYFTQVYPLFPQLSGLLTIQVTVFPNQGICIGVTIQHIAGDGASMACFLKSWASACKSGALTATPIYDRGLVPENPGMYDILCRVYSQQIQSRPVTSALPLPSKAAFVASFTLRREHIERLKKQVIEGGEQVHCSTFVVSCAYAWVCLVRALGYDSDSTAHFIFPVDCRGRLDPPLPPSYFGNCLTCGVVDGSVSVLTGEGGVVAAAVRIVGAVEQLKVGDAEADEQLRTKLTVIARKRNLFVSWSPKFGVYDVDFGWGRPIKAELPPMPPPISKSKDVISLTETREGDGGVEISVTLEEGEMEEFEDQFYRGLAKLSK